MAYTSESKEEWYSYKWKGLEKNMKKSITVVKKTDHITKNISDIAKKLKEIAKILKKAKKNVSKEKKDASEEKQITMDEVDYILDDIDTFVEGIIPAVDNAKDMTDQVCKKENKKEDASVEEPDILKKIVDEIDYEDTLVKWNE